MRYAHGKPSGASNPSAPAFYEWSVAGQPLSIQLSLELIDRLRDDVMKGFWAVPKRGAEVGGILLGRIVAGENGATVWVEDYEPVNCEHRRGPSYVLSEADRRRMERTLRRAGGEAQVVGFFRSHTRLGLYLDQDDFSVIQSYFANPNHVFLLVRPHATKPLAAGFFFWEEGSIRRQATYKEFPLGRAELLKSMGFEQPQEEEAPPPTARAAARPALPAAPPRRQWRMPRLKAPPGRWRGVALAALALATFGLLEYQVVRGRNQEPDLAAADVSPALRVERNGSYLQVIWNRHAPAALGATHGVLTITDGAYRKELQLDAGQLRYGSVAYAPSGTDVNFRLQLLGSGRPVSESLRVVTGAPAQPVRAAAPESAPAPAAAASPPAQAATAVRAATPPAPVHKAVQPRPQPVTVRTAQKAKPKGRRVWMDDGL
jgi:hypothetical protein